MSDREHELTGPEHFRRAQRTIGEARAEARERADPAKVRALADLAHIDILAAEFLATLAGDHYATRLPDDWAALLNPTI